MAYLGQVDRKASNVQVFNVTSSTSATHDIGWTPPSEQTLIVTINGVKQHTNAFSFSGSTLTLGAALVATDELEVIGINDIGNSLTPVDGSVTTSKLGDNSVTLDKMAGLARGKIIVGDSSGDPSALALGASTYLLTSDGSDAAWAAAPAGGLTHVSQWSLTADFTDSANPITTNLAAVDAPAGYGKLPASGEVMTLSSGAFQFPVTGTWWVEFSIFQTSTNYMGAYFSITTTTDNATYATAAYGDHMDSQYEGSGVGKLSILFNVDNTTNCKCKFNTTQHGATVTTRGDTNINETYMTFMRLGDPI